MGSVRLSSCSTWAFFFAEFAWESGRGGLGNGKWRLCLSMISKGAKGIDLAAVHVHEQKRPTMNHA